MSQSSPKRVAESQGRIEVVDVGTCCAAALQALDQGDVPEAKLWADRCAALPDSDKDARYAGVRGRIAAARGNFVEAAEHFQTALRLDPDQVVLARQLVEVLQTEGRLEEAVDVLERLTRNDSQEADLFIDLGYARLASGNRAGARKAVERAAALRPQDKAVQFALAQMYEAIQEPALAVEVLSGKMGDEASPRVLNELARLLLHLNRYADAELTFRGLRDKDSAAQLMAQHGIIWCRIKQADWRGALQSALDASRLDCYGVTTKFLAYAKDRVFGGPLATPETEAELLKSLCGEMDEYAELHCSEAIAG